jgi:hypothetical protein
MPSTPPCPRCSAASTVAATRVSPSESTSRIRPEFRSLTSAVSSTKAIDHGVWSPDATSRAVPTEPLPGVGIELGVGPEVPVTVVPSVFLGLHAARVTPSRTDAVHVTVTVLLPLSMRRLRAAISR